MQPQQALYHVYMYMTYRYSYITCSYAIIHLTWILEPSRTYHVIHSYVWLCTSHCKASAAILFSSEN